MAGERIVVDFVEKFLRLYKLAPHRMHQRHAYCGLGNHHAVAQTFGNQHILIEIMFCRIAHKRFIFIDKGSVLSEYLTVGTHLVALHLQHRNALFLGLEVYVAVFDNTVEHAKQ